MILKSKRNVESEGISVNQLYPVLEYEKSAQSGIVRYKIYDDSKSMSWKTGDNFNIESDILEKYVQRKDSSTYIYRYVGIEENFYIKLNLESEESQCAVQELEKIIINIISDELSIEVIMNNINELGFNSEEIEMQLNAFFRKAKKQEVIQFAIELYDKVTEINSYILSIIIDNMKMYKDNDIENLFIEIYMSTSCNEKELNTINDYLG